MLMELLNELLNDDKILFKIFLMKTKNILFELGFPEILLKEYTNINTKFILKPILN